MRSYSRSKLTRIQIGYFDVLSVFCKLRLVFTLCLKLCNYCTVIVLRLSLNEISMSLGITWTLRAAAILNDFVRVYACGEVRHYDRDKVCPARGETCAKCGDKGR